VDIVATASVDRHRDAIVISLVTIAIAIVTQSTSARGASRARPRSDSR
jgi:hypothetical protein